jgi:hypothetical protein
MKRHLYTVLMMAATLTASAQSKLTSGGKLKPEQANMDVRHYTIALDVNFEQKTIDGYTTIDIITAKPTHVLLFDLLDSLNVSSVLVNGKKEPFTYKNNMITINTVKELPAGKASVKVVYGGKPHIAVRPPWDDGFTFTRDSTGHNWLAITAEGTGGKVYYPCKDHPSDEPNEGADLIITVPKDLVVAGPGLLVKTSKQGNKATFHWKTNYSINNYSILFNVGELQIKYETVKKDNKIAQMGQRQAVRERQLIVVVASCMLVIVFSIILFLQYRLIRKRNRLTIMSSLRKDKALEQIAFIQSHELRKPLASILGLITVLKFTEHEVDREALDKLEEAGEELDMAIRSIIVHVEEEAKG